MFTAHKEARRRVESLRWIPFVAGCTFDELKKVDRLGAQIEVRPGSTLTSEGAVGRECFVVLEGDAAVQRAGRPVSGVGAGSIAGEMALLDRTVRNATVVATSPMRLLVLTNHEFDELRAISPRIESNLAEIAKERRQALSAAQ